MKTFHGTPAKPDDLQRPEKEIMKILSTSKGPLSKKEIDQILIWPSSYTRFQTFLRLIPRLKGKNYWHALKNTYASSDNTYSIRHEIKKAFGRRFKGRDALMSTNESRYLKSLPESVYIYRGMTEQEFESGEFGISWTLKEKTARFFCNYYRNHDTHHMPKMVAKTTVKKKDIVAIFLERKEFEVIIVKKVLANKL